MSAIPTVLVLLQILRVLAWAGPHKAAEGVCFRSQEEMARVWVADGGKAENRPKVDWEKEMVLALFAGEKPTGGFKVEIEKVIQVQVKDKKGGRETLRTKDLVVLYRGTAPAPGAAATDALTYPAHVVVVPKSEGQVLFFDVVSEPGKHYLGALGKAAPDGEEGGGKK